MQKIIINNKVIGKGEKPYIIAELSANHNQSFEAAKKLIVLAKKAGADAVKLQTYTPDTITIQSHDKSFILTEGDNWKGKTLYDLYSEAYTPWEWQPELKKIANGLGMDLFSTPFDKSAVDFLEEMDVPAYKIASFELVDLPLIEYVAKMGKPMILSTGMAKISEISDAIKTIKKTGNRQYALLKCTSEYPASLEDMNLLTIPDLIKRFNVPVGISDHSLSGIVPVVATSVGASIVEKHFTFSRSIAGPDSSFSLEPQEFEEMVRAITNAKITLGKVKYGPMKLEQQSYHNRRSLYVVHDIRKGEIFSELNVRSIRPGFGLPPKKLFTILGKKSKFDIKKGTPLTERLIR